MGNGPVRRARCRRRRSTALALPELFDELVAAHELRPERLQATDGTDIVGADVGFGTFVPGLDLPKASPAQVAANVAAGGGVTIFGVDDHSPALARWFEQWDRAVEMAVPWRPLARGSWLRRRSHRPTRPCRLVIAAEGAARIRVWPADEGSDDRPLVPARQAIGRTDL